MNLLRYHLRRAGCCRACRSRRRSSPSIDSEAEALAVVDFPLDRRVVGLLTRVDALCCYATALEQRRQVISSAKNEQSNDQCSGGMEGVIS